MSEKISLMSDEVVEKIRDNYPSTHTHFMVRDECEKRAMEKIQEVFVGLDKIVEMAKDLSCDQGDKYYDEICKISRDIAKQS